MGGDDGSSQMGFQNQSEVALNCPSSGMNTRLPLTVSSIYGSGWDPMVSLSQSGNFGGVSSMVSQGNLTQGINCSFRLDNYPSDPNFAQMLPKLPMLGSGSFPEFVDPYGSPGIIQNSNAPVPQNYSSNKSRMDEKLSANAVQADNDCQISKGKDAGVSPNGKRKRSSEPSPSNKIAEKAPQKQHSGKASGLKEQDDKRQKYVSNDVGNSSVKQTGKQQDNCQEDEPKQNYIHVRARRGQATNSHSLAERVRREKISERMRLLQELVPGCNKITGKAVMLDEIINYVQSLQQQVEFLSMKLATVNPELNSDIDRLLSKDILHSRGNGSPFLGFDQGMRSSHGLTHGIYQGNLITMPNSAAQYHHISQAVWDSDLQNLLQMGFDPNPAVGSLGPIGGSKTEQ